jgi:HYR domain
LRTRLLAPLLAAPAACLALASPAAAGTDLPRYTPGLPGHVGVAAKYHSNEREINLTDSQDPRNRQTVAIDKTEGTAQAQTSQNHPGGYPDWSQVPCDDEANGGCSGADTRTYASADVEAGRLETWVLGWAWLGHRPFEASASNAATAHVDDSITLSAPATVTLRGRVRGSTEGEQSTGERWPLRVKLLFQRPDSGEGEIVEGLDATYDAPHFDETFEVPVALPAGTVSFNAEVHAEVLPQLFDGSTFVRDQAMIDTSSGENGVTFEIVVPDTVSASSGSGKLPIVGGAQAPPADTTPPVLNLPGLQVVDATGPDGATVAYSARASDDSGVDPAVQCSPASGTVFAIGLHEVSCTAADAAGNVASGIIPVRVTSAAEQLTSLIARVSTLPRSLRITLGAIVGRSQPVQCLGLRTFTVLVIALRRLGSITDADVRDLNGRAERIRAVLAC